MLMIEQSQCYAFEWTAWSVLDVKWVGESHSEKFRSAASSAFLTKLMERILEDAWWHMSKE
jgi:hypothetical protein